MSKPFKKMLPCTLTLEEINRAAMQSAQLTLQYREAEIAKKEITDQLTSRLKSLRAAMETEGEKATRGTEVRPVDCEWVILREDGKKRLFRQDTGEMIEEKEMTEEDMQESLFAT